MIGQTVSHYKILEELGSGGMGVVYKAEDTKLKRTVALKFLSPYVLASEEERTRFMHEAQAAAALRHPGVCTVYEIDEDEGRTFIVMEYIEGRNLRDMLSAGPMQPAEIVEIVRPIAEAMQEAHEKGIVHRDIKPANIVVTPEGQAVLTDFGLAKTVGSAPVTRTGTTVGTVAYMSPEQAGGGQADHRTDVWSLGAVVYEMLTGRRPFTGEFENAVIYSILNSEMTPPSKIRSDIPAAVENTILKALTKDRDARFQSMREFLDALVGVTGKPASAGAGVPVRRWRGTRIAIPLVVVVVALVGLLLVRDLVHRGHVIRARREVLPAIAELVTGGEYLEAYELSRGVEDLLRDNETFQELRGQFMARARIVTTPGGADVYAKPYQDTVNPWQRLGLSPIEAVEMPRGFYRWKVEKTGYDELESAGWMRGDSIAFALVETASTPSNMVMVPGGTGSSWLTGVGGHQAITVSDYLMDRHEVTNGEYQSFVDAGGYSKTEFWKHPFVEGGETVSWREAVRRFRDATGRPGPSTWELGRFKEGEEHYPVTGVCWYEAAAYAEFVGKDLPTVFHWVYAAPVRENAYVSPLSNFGDRGLAPVEEHRGVGFYGTYDMAGNAREWCFNSSGNGRYLLGGCWSDPFYMFNIADSRSAWDRSPGNGFRCVKYLSEDSLLTTAKRYIAPDAARDFYKETPVSDELFSAYSAVYFYDKTPLNAEIEFTDDEPEDWTIQKILFDAAYGNERVFAYLFLPRGVEPPYQTLVLFPGAYALSMRSSGNGRTLNSWDAVDFIIKSGRAVLCPVYKSTYERGDGYDIYDPATTLEAHNEHLLMFWKDLSRSLDYLETRPDIDHDRIGYVGSSYGAWISPLYLAQDKRFKVAVLRLVGLLPREMTPAFDPFNFVTRVKIPVLMINGRYDYIFPHETSQVPMFRLLGTPNEHKRHVVFDTGHTCWGHRNEMIREVLDWLDRYLGPVEKQSPL
jgi:formylglycine-generating enzyme required for sulfatase activity/dienelactone hydrolase/predicted Ser/Thr protein kinase